MSALAILPLYGALAAGVVGFCLAAQPNAAEKAAGVGLLTIASGLGYVARGM